MADPDPGGARRVKGQDKLWIAHFVPGKERDEVKDDFFCSKNRGPESFKPFVRNLYLSTISKTSGPTLGLPIKSLI